MKTLLNILILQAIYMAIIYILIAVISWNFNPGSWDSFTRFWLTVPSLICAVMHMAIRESNKED